MADTEKKYITEDEIQTLLKKHEELIKASIEKSTNEERTRVASMKPWEIELCKVSKSNINSPYGKECCANALNAYLSEHKEIND